MIRDKVRCMDMKWEWSYSSVNKPSEGPIPGMVPRCWHRCYHFPVSSDGERMSYLCHSFQQSYHSLLYLVLQSFFSFCMFLWNVSWDSVVRNYHSYPQPRCNSFLRCQMPDNASDANENDDGMEYNRKGMCFWKSVIYLRHWRYLPPRQLHGVNTTRAMNNLHLLVYQGRAVRKECIWNTQVPTAEHK